MKFFQILMLACCSNIAAFAQSPASLIEKGNQSYSIMKFEDAEKYYEIARKADKSRQYHLIDFNLAGIYYQKKDYDASIGLYSQFITNTRDHALQSRAYYNTGNCYLAQKNYRKAIATFVESLKLNPKNEDARYNLSYVITLLGGSENNSTSAESDEPDKKDSKQKSPPLKPLTPEEQERLQKLLSESEMKNEPVKKEAKKKLVKDW
ncbi:MAG: tetratricopeptide repeat protein [Chitinophagales bacterium]